MLMWQTSFAVSVPVLNRLKALGVLLLEQPKIKLLFFFFFWPAIPEFPGIARAGGGGADVW